MPGRPVRRSAPRRGRGAIAIQVTQGAELSALLSGTSTSSKPPWQSLMATMSSREVRRPSQASRSPSPSRSPRLMPLAAGNGAPPNEKASVGFSWPVPSLARASDPSAVTTRASNHPSPSRSPRPMPALPPCTSGGVCLVGVDPRSVFESEKGNTPGQADHIGDCQLAGRRRSTREAAGLGAYCCCIAAIGHRLSAFDSMRSHIPRRSRTDAAPRGAPAVPKHLERAVSVQHGPMEGPQSPCIPGSGGCRPQSCWC